ncbi:MAG: hypothetical protein U0793_24510 [Gemmataceae bacterium]
MRSLMFGLATALCVGAVGSPAEAAPKTPVNRGVVPGVPLVPGARIQGVLIDVDVVGRVLLLNTDRGIVRVPVGGRLQVQNGLTGRPIDQQLGGIRTLASRGATVIVVGTRDGIIAILIGLLR